uniref:DNA-directed RNA polymerase subunit n=1 Tax=Trebouxia aggregata TaxID=160068 RepID=G8XPB8_9CHLO|nr:beta' subunit of RNA polymerase [Trebouxia aggregata]
MWAERPLVSGMTVGRILNAQTVNYKTLRPVMGGFFCERIFGPIKDFECACERKSPSPKKMTCRDCHVDYTSSTVRRHRLGYIELNSPVTHIWYLKGRINYISIFLGYRRKRVEAVTYCTEKLEISDRRRLNFSFSPAVKKCFKKVPCYSYIEKDNPIKIRGKLDKIIQIIKDIDKLVGSSKKISQRFSLPNSLPISREFPWETQKDRTSFFGYMTCLPQDGDIPIPTYSNVVSNLGIKISNFSFTGLKPALKVLDNTGGSIIQKRLRRIKPKVLYSALQDRLFEFSFEISDLQAQSYLILWDFRRLQRLITHRAKVIRRLKLARDFIENGSLPKWMTLSVIPVIPPDLRPIIQLDGDQVAVSDLNKLYQNIFFRNNRFNRISTESALFAQRLLQEAVDALIENGKGGSEPIRASNDRPLKSLSDILKGKKGRFRQNLLGKRVDYSGRSVIVVGPTLKLHQCGLPKEMAIELFQPFLIRQLVKRNIVSSIVKAKRFIKEKDQPLLLWDLLQQIMDNHPILLNRAPTLHRLGIQAFQPKLVNGRAILLHPLVCTAFNADFDGDQMAVHVPLSAEAQAEAWKLMWSRNHLLSPATGQPILVPSQDMVLGCYYLTTFNSKPQLTPLKASNTRLGIPSPTKKAKTKDCFPLGNERKKEEASVKIFDEGTQKNLRIGKDKHDVSLEEVSWKRDSKKRIRYYFSDSNDLLKAYYQKEIDLHQSVWVRKNGSLESEKTLESPLEIRVNSFGQHNQIFSTYQYDYDPNGKKVKQYVRTTPGRVLLNTLLFA